ncbi:MAG TPA: VCBS repeat-containing protein, partial [Flavitalea sp.]|nr:VCBS repeat-containing protein [Flavitalea sp.]
GSGVFSVAGDEIIQLKNIGMVTSAAFGDLNSDGKPDLVIAGEWMPVTIFFNTNNRFRAVSQNGSSGLWQTLLLNDVNGDGFTDIVAGNWGINSKLATGKSGPLRLYVKDFDNNGVKDPVLTYSVNNKEYTFLPKDELEQVVPALKKKFLYYNEFAGKEVKDIFDISSGDNGKLEVNDLASAIFYNDGKGNLTKMDLPMELQLTPLFCFAKDSAGKNWFAGGNFYGVLPYEGQYDASSFMGFQLADSKITNTKVLEIKGEVRDMKWIRTASKGDVLIVARNNDSLLFYSRAKR